MRRLMLKHPVGDKHRHCGWLLQLLLSVTCMTCRPRCSIISCGIVDAAWIHSVPNIRINPYNNNYKVVQPYYPSRTVTTVAPLRLSSSSSSSVNSNNDVPSALVPITTVPPLDEILDSYMDSLQRIIQTISMILQSQQQQQKQPSDAAEIRVQQIVEQILQICDEYDEISNVERNIEIAERDSDNDFMERLRNINGDTVQEQLFKVLHHSSLKLQISSLQYQRYELLVQLMQSHYTTYITTASFLCSDNRPIHNAPTKMQRYELPNVQDVPYNTATTTTSSPKPVNEKNDDSLVPDCTLSDMEYKDSILDQVLLYIFRSLVTKHTNGITSTIPGIRGLLEQGRTYMVQQRISHRTYNIRWCNTHCAI
jgi:hypothetical protein